MFMFVKVPSPVPETNLQIAYGVSAFFAALFGPEGEACAGKLQCGLRAVSLLSHPALSSAFANDVGAGLVYAQQLLAHIKGA